MQTLTIEILNDKVMNLLKGLEQLKLIRLMKHHGKAKESGTDLKKFKGAMKKEQKSTIDKQLKEIRGSWE